MSFILTFYNLPVKMLCECIDSILALSLRNYEREIIVVDDGSENSPISELTRYGSEIIYIRQHNQGLSQARNMGIRVAQGRYLQFIDGDDTLVVPSYEHCLDLIRFNQQPDMVIFDFTKHLQETSNKATYQTSEQQSGIDYMRHNNIRGTACGYFFKRSVLGELRFTPGIYNEDEEFTPQLLLRAEHVCSTDAQAYFYRSRPNSIITNNNIRHILKKLCDTRDIIFRLNIMADRLPVDERTALQRRIAQLTMDYLYNIIRQTKSRHYLERKIVELRKEGLFPLPDRNYTAKYMWFRRMINSSAGINLLLRVIPLIRKER